MNHNEHAPPRLFIGGTGRSGTTILYRAIGCHADIYALPREMRFLTDHHGLMNLVDALSTRYNHVQAREALFHFEQLMRVELASPDGSAYPGYDLPRWLGSRHYYECLDAFIGQLVEFEFEGLRVPLRREPSGDWYAPAGGWRGLLGLRGEIRQANLPLQPVPVPRYFPRRGEILSLAAGFVDSLFLLKTRQAGKRTWCEKSPANLQNLDFLRELFPDSFFIHMVRDPRAVVASMRRVHWAPVQIDQICAFLKRMYLRWEAVRAGLDLDESSYLEIRLEDFAADPRPWLARIARRCGLADSFTDLPEISADRVQRWRSELSRAEVSLIEAHLGEYIAAYGYPPRA